MQIKSHSMNQNDNKSQNDTTTLKAMTVEGQGVQDPDDPYNKSYIVTNNSRLMPVNYRSEENRMTTLKHVLELKNNQELTPPGNLEKRSIKNEDDLIDLFPLPRYFQIHFEHIHDNTHDVQGKLKHLNHDIQNQLDQLKQSLASVEGKLDSFIAILGITSNQDIESTD